MRLLHWEKFLAYRDVVCVCVCQPCSCLVLMDPEEGIGFPRTEVKDCYGLPCGSWRLNLGPLCEQ
ncbi:mCG1036279 [Mus musculus]|nr:mCG1036279 [Mus musculus]